MVLEVFFIFNTFLKLFSNMTLFIFFSKTNTFGCAYSHGAVKSRCHAMYGGAVGAMTWQRPGPLNADVAEVVAPWI